MKRTIVMTAGWLLAAASQAQTLGSALAQAWSRHPQATALTAREAQALAGVDVAAGLTPSPPSLSLSNENDRLQANGGKNAWELELAVPLWLPGQRAAHARASSSAVAEVEAKRAALRLQLAGELREAWWALAATRQAVDLAERRQAAARALEADVTRRFKAGELARVDANLAQNERLASEAEGLEAHAALRQAEQNYRLLTGETAPAELREERLALPVAAAGTDRQANTELPPPSQRGAPDNQGQGPSTLPLHPQLAAAQAAAQAAQARLQVAQQTRRNAPELAVKWVRDRSDFQAPYANAVGIKLTVPLSSGAHVRQETAGAQADAAQADAELALTQQRLSLGAARARFDVDVARQQMEKAQTRQALTADTRSLAEKSFALGESDLSTLLRARAAALEADAVFNRQQTAGFAGVSRLNQSLGVLP